jgi:glycine/D-amino acid oxidase-like deaminating enzyme
MRYSSADPLRRRAPSTRLADFLNVHRAPGIVTLGTAAERQLMHSAPGIIGAAARCLGRVKTPGRLAMSARKDVIIVGAGVIGCSIAYHLGRRGISACIVERESIATRASGKAWAVFTYPPSMLAYEKGYAASSGESHSGTIDLSETPPGESVEDWLYLHTASYDRMPEFALELAERGEIDIEYCETPSTNLVTQKKLEEVGGPQQLLRPFREAGGFECDWIDSDALRELFPALNPDYVGGITAPEGQLEPYKFTLSLAQAAESLGAEIVQGEVVGFATQGDRITGVQLASGTELQADAVVLAMGPWTGQGSARLGREIGCRAFLAQCLRAEVPGGLPLHILGGGDYWILPKRNGEVILAMYGPDLIERPDLDASLTEEVKLETLRGVAEVLPTLEDAKLLEHRGDLLAMAPTPPYNKPVMGRLPEWQNGYIASRFGSLGVCMSPATGEIMAELIETGKAPLRARRMLERIAPGVANG